MPQTPTIIFSDNPKIVVDIKGTKFSIPFQKSFRFCRPSAWRALQSDSDGDRRVHKETWWILCDIGLPTASELRCSWEGIERGFQVTYSTIHSAVSVKIAESDMGDILRSIEHMVLVSVIDCGGEVSKEQVKILKPFGSELEYRVISIAYEAETAKPKENVKVSSLLAVPKKQQAPRPFH